MCAAQAESGEVLGAGFLSDRRKRALRAKGHQIPELQWIDKKSKLTLDARVYVLKRLWTARKLIMDDYIRNSSEHLPPPRSELRRMLRNDWQACRDARRPDGSPVNKEWQWQALHHFARHSFSAFEKAGDATRHGTEIVDDEFFGALDFLCHESTSDSMIREELGLLEQERMERAGHLPAGDTRRTAYSIYERHGVRRATEGELKTRTITHDVGDWSAKGRRELETLDARIRTERTAAKLPLVDAMAATR